MSTQDKVKMYDEAVREHKLACQRLRQAEEKMLALRKAMLSDIQMVRRGQPNSRRRRALAAVYADLQRPRVQD